MTKGIDDVVKWKDGYHMLPRLERCRSGCNTYVLMLLTGIVNKNHLYLLLYNSPTYCHVQSS